jgi:hypothetical protein
MATELCDQYPAAQLENLPRLTQVRNVKHLSRGSLEVQFWFRRDAHAKTVYE